MTSETGSRSDRLENSLIEIAVETWRFSRIFARAVNKLDAGEASRYPAPAHLVVMTCETKDLRTVPTLRINISATGGGEPTDHTHRISRLIPSLTRRELKLIRSPSRLPVKRR